MSLDQGLAGSGRQACVRRNPVETDEGVEPLVATIGLVARDERAGVSCRLTSRDQLRRGRLATWDRMTWLMKQQTIVLRKIYSNEQ